MLSCFVVHFALPSQAKREKRMKKTMIFFRQQCYELPFDPCMCIFVTHAWLVIET